MDEIMAAVATLRDGDRESGRAQLLKCWDIWGGTDSALERATIAHFLADTEQSTIDELRWDLIALEAATGSSESRCGDAVQAPLAAFLPSLHLNVGDAYRRLGDRNLSRKHAQLGLSTAHLLAKDGYGSMIKGGLARLLARLDSEDSEDSAAGGPSS